MNFVSTRIITADIKRLVRFYERIAGDLAVPLGRVGRAEEFSDLVCFLLSERAAYVTGNAINLDGGLSPTV